MNETIKRVAFTPIGARVLIKPLDNADDKTRSGIIIPEAAKEKTYRGHVVAVGPGKRDGRGVLVPMEVKLGDLVLYGRFSGSEIKLDDVNYILAHEGDCLAVEG